MAGHPDRRCGQSRPGHRRRRQGRRAPGVQREPGHRHDGAVLRAPGRAGPGQREAARLAGLPRDPVPARQPRPVLPDDAARLRRTAVVPEPHQGPGQRRLLHRLGRARRGRPPVRRRGPALRRRAFRRAAAQPLRRADRRCRAGRGQHLGSRRRPGHRWAWRRAVDRGRQPAVPGPGRARRPHRPVGAAIQRGGLARGRGQVRPGAAGRRSASPAATALRDWIDAMPNEHYQSLFGLDPAQCGSGSWTARRRRSATFCAGIPDDDELARLVTDLAGHDLGSLLAAFAECDAEKDRPSVLFAYTIKGWGLPIAGNPRNHSALLSTAQVDQLRVSAGPDRGHRVGPARPDDASRAVGGSPSRAPRQARPASMPGTPSTCPMPPDCARPGRSPPRRRSAGSWSTCPGWSRSRRTW